jgi:hypothetical protein
MLNFGFVEKILSMLRSNDPETLHWAFSVLHEYIKLAKSHAEFFRLNGLDQVLRHAQSKEHQAQFYIADIIAQLCGNDFEGGNFNSEALISSRVVDVAIEFCKSTDEDLASSGVALLFNFVNFSEQFSKQIIQNGGILLLSRFLRSEANGHSQVLAAKTLQCLANFDEEVRFEVLIFAVRPLFQRLPLATSDSIRKLFPNLSLLEASKTNESFSAKPEGAESGIKTSRSESFVDLEAISQSSIDSNLSEIFVSCDQLVTLLVCMEIFSSSKMYDKMDERKMEQTFEQYLDDLLAQTASSLLDILVLNLMPSETQFNEIESRKLENFTTRIVINAAKCLQNIIRYSKNTLHRISATRS